MLSKIIAIATAVIFTTSEAVMIEGTASAGMLEYICAMLRRNGATDEMLKDSNCETVG